MGMNTSTNIITSITTIIININVSLKRKFISNVGGANEMFIKKLPMHARHQR
jgi:hypothetical protein